MIPTMLVFGLGFGRWWRAAIVTAAVAWPVLLAATGVTTSISILLAGAALGALNAAVGVLVHQGLLWLVRRTWRGIRRFRAHFAPQNG